METYQTLASIFTALSFAVFMGIVYWAYSARRKPAFALAALEPFAIPDEHPGERASTQGERS
ncbi:MAG TPA: CcoQ/FixQ family Cbb3-type cytochrome c oxidase assembly chaperone [Casimicrobiaceae bacterium]|nr:CcoQ/FixQ family Cbb3-type cytochrome c oxidase assembly chaperone [Casimicrobiaceae bacterium]